MKIIHTFKAVMLSAFLFASALQAFSQQSKPAINRPVPDSQFTLTFDSHQQKYSNDYTKVLHDKLKRGSDDELKLLTRSEDVAGNVHQRFQQYYKGVKVEHGIVIAHSKNSSLT